MKVRLELPNPAIGFGPGMFVDVEFPVSLPVRPHRAGRRRRRLRAAKDGLRRSRQRLLRAAARRDRLAGRRPRGDHQGPHGRRADRDRRATSCIDSESRMKAAAHGHRRRRRRDGPDLRHGRGREAGGGGRAGRRARGHDLLLLLRRLQEAIRRRAGQVTQPSRTLIHRIIDFSVRQQVPRPSAGRSGRSGRRLWSLQRVPLDAIPDLSDTQVIIYSRWDRSPDIVEEQVTYPIVTAMLGAPKVQRRPRLLGLRLLVRLRHLRGRHRHLLGAHAHARVPLGRARRAAAGRQDRAGAGRDRPRLGLPVRAGRQVGQAQPGRAPLRIRTGICATT